MSENKDKTNDQLDVVKLYPNIHKAILRKY